MKLRIAQIGPLWENIPPPKYGGTERIVHYLTEGLVEKGHDVTLYACGTTITKAKLVSVYPRPLFRDNVPWWNVMYPLLNITEAFAHEKEYDIIHMHLNQGSDFMALPLCQSFKQKMVFTLHFPYEFNYTWKGNTEVFQKYKDLQYISISNSQRRGGENLNWLKTIYNGVDMDLYKLNERPEDYFLWLGKFNPDKGAKEALLAAKKANIKLMVAGTIDKVESEDYKYYKNEIEPLIDGKQIVFIGELEDKKKNEVYGASRGFLNPIKWNEPFGLVMAESMATGTPVISFNNGAAPEIIKDGETGFIVSDVDEMVKKIGQIDTIDRRKCRQRVEEYFSTKKMVDEYEGVYNVIASGTK
jgi:glycosyltransferase involved in cell wall biosynthesis